MKINITKEIIKTPTGVQIGDIVCTYKPTSDFKYYGDGKYISLYKIHNIRIEKCYDILYTVVDVKEYSNRRGKIHKKSTTVYSYVVDRTYSELRLGSVYYDSLYKVDQNHNYIIHKIKQMEDNINKLRSL